MQLSLCLHTCSGLASDSPFLSPEAALLLVRITKNHHFQEGLTPEVHGLPVTLRMLWFKSDKSDWLRIRNDYAAHSWKIGPCQRSGFLVVTKRSAVSGDENADSLVPGSDPSLRSPFSNRWLLSKMNLYDTLSQFYQLSYIERNWTLPLGPFRTTFTNLLGEMGRQLI